MNVSKREIQYYNKSKEIRSYGEAKELPIK